MVFQPLRPQSEGWRETQSNLEGKEAGDGEGGKQNEGKRWEGQSQEKGPVYGGRAGGRPLGRGSLTKTCLQSLFFQKKQTNKINRKPARPG